MHNFTKMEGESSTRTKTKTNKNTSSFSFWIIVSVRLPLANSSFVENLHGRIFVLIIIRLKDKTLLSKKSNKAHYFSSNLVRVFIFWLVTYNAQDSNEWEKKKKEKHHQPTTDCHCGLVFGSISSRVWLALLWLYSYTSPLHNETCFKTKPAGRQQQTSTSAEKRIRKNRNWKSSPYTVGKPTKKRQAAKESMVEWPTGQEKNGWFSPSFVSRSDTAAKFICFRRSNRCWNVCRVFFSQRNANIENAAHFLSSAHRRPSRMR